MAEDVGLRRKLGTNCLYKAQPNVVGDEAVGVFSREGKDRQHNAFYSTASRETLRLHNTIYCQVTGKKN